MTKYRAAIIGLSSVGAGVWPGAVSDSPLGGVWPNSHAAGYALFPQAEVVAVCDLKPELLEQFQATWGSTWSAVRTYTDYAALLERERIDLLSVVTPDHVHAQIVVDAAERGVRGILCEKPIATSLADADRMMAACERARHGDFSQPSPAVGSDLPRGAGVRARGRWLAGATGRGAAHCGDVWRAARDAVSQRHAPDRHDLLAGRQ